MSTHDQIKDGLIVSEQGHSWGVYHAGSQLQVVTGFRQRRFAEQARDDLLATGTDFTADAEAVTADRARWVSTAQLWVIRARQDHVDPVTFEHYSWSTHYGQIIPSAAQAAAWRDGAPLPAEVRRVLDYLAQRTA
jgi:hypothetical protein